MAKRTPLSNKRTKLTVQRSKLTNIRSPSSGGRTVAVDQTAPEWKNESWDITWTTGDAIDYDVRQHLEPGNDILHYTFEITVGVLPTALTIDNGIISGLISAVTGGTYVLTVKATNPLGNQSSSDDLSIVLVGLEIGNPTLENIPDLGNTEQGASVTVNCLDYLTDDGNPAGTEALLWFIDDTSDTLTGHVINLLTGVYTVTIDDAQSTGPYDIVIKVTNQHGFSTTDTFSIPIIENATSAPTITGWFSGNASCDAVVDPTWEAGGATFSIALSDRGDKSIDMLGLHLASNGGAAITEVLISSGGFPTNHNFTLQETAGGAGIGFITGDTGTATDADTGFVLKCKNSTGVYVDSPTFTFSIWDDTAEVPTLNSIDATEGTNDVFVNFSESVYTTAGDAASYELGFAFKVNGDSRTPAYSSGGASGRIKFTLDGTVLSGNNTVELTYTTTSSDLKSVSADVHVGTTTPANYVVPVPPAEGVIFTDSFDTGDLSHTDGGFIWTNQNNTSISTAIARTGSNSLKFAYPAGQGQGFAEQRFLIDSTAYNEIYLQFYIYHPDGTEGIGNKFVHSNASPNNNKLIRLRGSDPPASTTDFHVTSGASTWYLAGGDSKARLDVYHPNPSTPCGDPADAGGAQGADAPFVNTSTIGTWMKVKYHIKLASASNDDGIMRLWINDSLEVDMQGMALYPGDTCINHFTSGYLMGANNAEFAAATNIYIDDVTLSTVDLP